MTLKLGLHAPPQGATATFHRVADGLRAEAITWLWSENPGDTKPGYMNIVRMPTPRVREDAGDYAARVHPQIAQWYASGIPAIFVPGNEPDLEGPWSLADWRTYLPRYTDWLKQEWAGIVLASPAFSVGHMDWMNADLVEGCDYACAHCYWPSDAPNLITDRAWGGAWQYAKRTGRPILITECNSNPTTPTQIVQWLRSLDSNVQAVTIFGADLAGSEWPFYDLTDQQAIVVRVGWQTAVPTPPPVPVPPVVPPPPAPPPAKTGLGYTPVSLATFYAMVDDGSGGGMSPFRTVAVYNAISAACQARDCSIRVPLAWLRSENNMATNISASLLGAHNAAGIKFIGQARATSGAASNPKVLAPANEGFAPYCVFASWEDFFYTLAVNIQTILPAAWASGDLARIASYYTSGNPDAGAGANKVLFYNQYSNLVKYPSGGSAPVPAFTGVPLETLRQKGLSLVGAKYTEEGTPEYGACEQNIEEILQDCGLIRVRYFSAATHIDALLQQGVPIYQGTPPPGAILLFDRRFDPNGHICMASIYPYVITTYPGSVSVIDGTRWYAANGYIGYYIPEGAGEGTTDVPLPSDGIMDWGEVQILWCSLGAAWNPQSGIFTDWVAKWRAGTFYGVPIGSEMGFENNSRVLLAFSTGFVAQWTAEDNRVAWLGTLPVVASVPPPASETTALTGKPKRKAA